MEQAMDQIKLYNILRNVLKMTEQDAGEFISAMGAVTSGGAQHKNSGHSPLKYQSSYPQRGAIVAPG